MAPTEFPGTALITGAGGTGIGSAVAHAFVRAGCPNVIITDVDPVTLETTHRALLSLVASSPCATSPTILPIPLDIADPPSVDRLFATITSDFGRLDYAVNVAGVLGDLKSSDQTALDEFDAINGVNYRGLWMCARREVGIMKAQEMREREGYGGARRQRGAIVNVASNLGLVGRPEAPVYTASKHAVIGLTKADAIDASPHRIRVNAVCPGVIDTPMTRPKPPSAESRHSTSASSGMDLQTAVDMAPMKRMGTAEEVADVCLFLSSERASFVQGATWAVDGGYTIM